MKKLIMAFPFFIGEKDFYIKKFTLKIILLKS